ncbi:hypothetical protein R3I94_011897 [Phoxinus phoxinus]|uniref:Saposin B-type domain-containing protein n=1 Tax=Phoxinus phoxinus TaxID=58324 RepID=A0AAN9H4Y5_9TELE
MSPVIHLGLLIMCSVLVECSSATNKAHWKSMLERNELNFPEEDKNSHELSIESDMNVITCWVCKKSIHEIKGIILHEIKKEIKAVCKAMKVLEHICEKYAYKYQFLIFHLLFPGNSEQTCQHLSMCK